MSKDRRQRFGIIGASVVLAVTSIGAAGAPAIAEEGVGPALTVLDPEKKLSHFLCYAGKLGGFSAEDSPSISVGDAIYDGPANVRDAVSFCNPVKKMKGGKVLAPIVSDRQHIKVYLIQNPSDGGTDDWQITNQLGVTTLNVSVRPDSLAVPTRKFPHKFPNGMDHYLCHPATGDDANVRFKLKDQFRRFKKMSIGRPFEFCAPTTKQHGNRDIGIRHPQVHLVCYQVSERELRPRQKPRTSNQFEKRRLIKAKRTNAFCVPSLAVLAT